MLKNYSSIPRLAASAMVAGVLSLPAFALEVGQAAPEFSLPSQAGKTVNLAGLRGHYIYVDFWASWCGPCKQSFPWMNALQAKHAASGFQVVAINVDEKPADATRFLGGVPASFTVLFDGKGVTPAAYAVQGMPTSFLVGPDGKVLLVHKSFKEGDRAELERRIAAAISATGTTP